MNYIQGLPKGFRGRGNSPNSVVVHFLQGIIIIILDTVLYWIKGFNANEIFQVSHDGTFENAPEFFHKICVNPITDNFLRLGEGQWEREGQEWGSHFWWGWACDRTDKIFENLGMTGEPLTLSAPLVKNLDMG